ncbi:MAG: hypothetical protein AAB074_06135 [Planctomycetota bacterium]
MPRAALVSALLIAASLSRAEEPASVEIRPGIKPGAKITRTMNTRGKGTITRESGGASTDFECRMSGFEELAEEILEAKDGRALKAKRRYERKESVFEVPAAGKKEEKTSSLAGRVLTLERKGGKTQATSPEKNVEPKDLASETLDDEWDVPLAPPGQVAAGDTWKADGIAVKAWASARGRTVEEASLDCKLVEVAPVKGRKCARIEVDFAAKGTTKPGEKQPEQKIAWTLKGDVWWSLEDGRVVAFDLKGDLTLEWDIAAAAGKPAEHWKSAMKIGLEGSSVPGEAGFEEGEGEGKK